MCFRNQIITKQWNMLSMINNIVCYKRITNIWWNIRNIYSSFLKRNLHTRHWRVCSSRDHCPVSLRASVHLFERLWTHQPRCRAVVSRWCRISVVKLPINSVFCWLSFSLLDDVQITISSTHRTIVNRSMAVSEYLQLPYTWVSST